MDAHPSLHTHQFRTDARILGIHVVFGRGHRGGMFGRISHLFGTDGTNDYRVSWKLGKQAKSKTIGTKISKSIRYGIMETQLATNLWRLRQRQRQRRSIFVVVELDFDGLSNTLQERARFSTHPDWRRRRKTEVFATAT